MKVTTRLKPLALAAIALAALAGHAQAANEVKLIKGGSVVSSYRGQTWYSDRFEAVVDNLAHAKRVSIYYKTLDNAWHEHELSFNRSVAGNKEVWTSLGGATYLANATDPIEFAVKYQVNGQTYWDNNNGSNYRLKKNNGNILAHTAVYNNYFASINVSSGSIYGSVTVTNFAPNKQVTVFYSTDGWKTTKQANAYFDPYYWFGQYSSVPNPNHQGFEEWRYALDVGTASKVEYAIKYTVNNSTYWDNNFGSNYATHIIQ